MKTIGRKTVKGEKTSAPKAVKAGAGKTSNKMATSATASRMAPTHEAIATRAYELYLARGAEHGHDAEDWARAKSELGL